jgi:DNA-binding NtrC family response regulator
VRCERWIEHAGLSLSLNAAAAASMRDALLHLAAEPVDVVVAGYRLDDATFAELLAEIRSRYPLLPVLAIGVPGERAPLDALAEGAVEVLAADDTVRLGATMVRAIRDAGLGRALRAAQDELQGVLTASDRHAALLTNAPALIWSTDDTLALRGVEGAEAGEAAAGRSATGTGTRAPPTVRASSTRIAARSAAPRPPCA